MVAIALHMAWAVVQHMQQLVYQDTQAEEVVALVGVLESVKTVADCSHSYAPLRLVFVPCLSSLVHYHHSSSFALSAATILHPLIFCCPRKIRH